MDFLFERHYDTDSMPPEEKIKVENLISTIFKYSMTIDQAREILESIGEMREAYKSGEYRD